MWCGAVWFGVVVQRSTHTSGEGMPSIQTRFSSPRAREASNMSGTQSKHNCSTFGSHLGYRLNAIAARLLFAEYVLILSKPSIFSAGSMQGFPSPTAVAIFTAIIGGIDSWARKKKNARLRRVLLLTKQGNALYIRHNT